MQIPQGLHLAAQALDLLLDPLQGLQALHRRAELFFEGVGSLQVVGVLDGLHLVLQLLQPLTLLTGLLQHHHKQHRQ